MHDDAYYYGLRTIARQRTLDAINCRIMKDGGAVEWDKSTLASIDDEAVAFAEEEWPKFYNAATHQGFKKPWSSIWYHASLQPSNFNLAIWQVLDGRKILQGLAVGNTSEGKEHLTLNWVERNFGPEYPRHGILIPVLLCLENYAALVGSQRVLIKNPIDPSKYTKYGYAPFSIQKSSSEFLCKEMPNG